ncbi:MAG: hypothetical protein ACRD3C_20545 [Vicinamibacterales bacterium]
MIEHVLLQAESFAPVPVDASWNHFVVVAISLTNGRPITRAERSEGTAAERASDRSGDGFIGLFDRRLSRLEKRQSTPDLSFAVQFHDLDGFSPLGLEMNVEMNE